MSPSIPPEPAMCGIAGIADVRKGVDPAALKAMTNTLWRRGPDDEQYYFNNPRPGGAAGRHIEEPLAGCDQKRCLKSASIEHDTVQSQCHMMRHR